MTWPPKMSLNRKSTNGHRALSRTPREHAAPWSTEPPIAKETPPMDSPTLISMRRILRDLVLTMTDPAEESQKKTTDTLEAMDDARLAAVAQEALTNVKRAQALFLDHEKHLKSMRKELEQLRADVQTEARAIDAAQKAIKERDDIAAKYKELQKQVDPERRQLEVMYAIDEATKATKEELSSARRELAQRQSEIDELKATKRRLKEANARLMEKL